jgi:prepilin-type N-terminal cleavage/methylation domain-containing protein
MSRPTRRIGFTLVELLVVIAIIGVLVALLLPAVQAAREAARRTQCKNQVKQMMLSMHNHESALRAFPSGGIGPWPNIKDFISGTGGAPFGPEKQGFSWAFQILPYLEGQTTYQVKTQAQLESIAIPMYNCPSRRPPTRNPVDGTYLMDYAAAVPSRTPLERPVTLNYAAPNDPWITVGCGRSESDFWLTQSGKARHQTGTDSIEAAPWPITGAGYMAPKGVIVRSNYCALCSDSKKTIGWYTRISFEHIEDGSSNTLVLSEKRLQPGLVAYSDWHDDRGWSDGWDPDTLRMTQCPPALDADMPAGAIGASALPYSFGGAHPSGMNAGFADASVRTVKYDIDPELFNYLAHRSDGQTIETEAIQ